MQFADLVRAGAYQVFVTALELYTPKIRCGQTHGLKRSARSPVHQDDTVAHRLAEEFEPCTVPTHRSDPNPFLRSHYRTPSRVAICWSDKLWFVCNQREFG